MARILVADDDAQCVGLLCRIGRRAAADVEVTTAADGREALESLSARPFDLAILGEEMPGMTGVQVIRCLRRRGVPTPVLLITGRPTPELTRQACAVGAVDLQEKPLMPLHVLGLVRKTLLQPANQRKARGRRSAPARRPDANG
ncbi:MAG: response regulator [Candidatus Latescibacterota bacterium]